MSRRTRTAVHVAAALVALKQHRFELAVGVIATAVVVSFIVLFESRLAALGVPPECVRNWLGAGADGREYCTPFMESWTRVFAADSQRIGGATSYLPFVVGLLLGVPIIARELELRTAQTAWSLNPSRVAWLARQAWPIAFSLGATLAVLAIGGDVVARQRVEWGYGSFELLDSFGVLVVVHGLTALAVGMAAGALLGRTLPAFLVAAMILWLVYMGRGQLREDWVQGQEPTVIGESRTAITVAWAWRTPDGSIISDAEGKALVPPDLVALDAGLAQALNSMGWLREHGYTLLPLGVSDAVASGWAVYDALFYGGIGIIATGLSAWVVVRRRPT